MRTIAIAVCFTVLARPANAQLPTISAARVAVDAAASDGAVDRRTVKYVAGGAALGAAAAIAGGALFHTLFPDTCALINAPCGSPNWVRLGVLGGIAGAVAGVYMASRQGENENRSTVQVGPPPERDGLALRILFR